MPALEPGLTLKQRYTLTATLATASGRAFYRAVDAQTGETVLLEFVSGAGLASASLERFQRTLETLRQIKHPNLLNPLDVFDHAGQLVVVTENAPGGALRDLLQQGPLAPERARQMTLDVADALSHAHRLGLTHGALTPDCIWLDEAGAPKLAGFGLTPLDLRYTPPEAWLDQPRDAQTDVWLLGAMLYEMLAGRPAFAGESAAAVRRRVLSADYAPLPPGTPAGLVAVTRRMLAAKKSARYAPLRQAAVDLELGVSPVASPGDATHPAQPPAKTRARPAPARRPRWLLTGLTILCALVAAGNLAAAYAHAAAYSQLAATQAQLAVATALPSETPSPVPTLTPLSPTASPTVTWTPLPPTAIPSVTASPTLMLSATPATPLTSPPSPTPPLPPPATQAEGLWRTSPVTWTSPVDGMILAFIPAGESVYSGAYINGVLIKSQVYLDAFWIDWTQVTNGQYARFRAARPDYQPLNCNANQPLFRDVKPAPSTADNYPVVNVNWYDAAAYCAWAGRRLPTAAEWVKVGGLGDSRFANGDDFCVGGNVLGSTNCQMPSGQIYSYQDYLLNPPDGYAYTAPVRNYPDINRSNNVLEWVADWYDPLYSPVGRNPMGPEIGFEHKRETRGSGWDMKIYTLLSPGYEPSYQSPSLGFRCAVSAAP